MKLLYIHQHFSTREGATGTRSFEFAKALVKRGHQVTMLCGSSQVANTGLEGAFQKGIRQGNVSGINVIEIDVPYSNHDGFLQRIKKFLHFSIKACQFSLRLDYDLLMATSTPLTVGLPCLVAKFLRRKKYIFEVRDLWPELPYAMGIIKNRFVYYLLSLAEKSFYRFASHCIALSPGMKKGIEKHGKSPQAVSLIPNGCDLNLPQPSTSQRVDWSPFQRDDFILVYSGAHGLANGLAQVLDLAAYLEQMPEAKHIHFLFIGDGKLKTELRQKAAALQLTRCHFWDPVPKTTLFHHILPRCQMGLMVLKNIPAFYHGTSPNKFFDYLSLGLPVITNYPGWVAELIEKNDCGYSVPPNNIEAFAKAILQAANDLPRLHQQGKNAYQLGQTQFNRHVLSQQFVEICESLQPYDKASLIKEADEHV